MAGTCVKVKDKGPFKTDLKHIIQSGNYASLREIGWQWVSDGSGDVSGNGTVNISGAIVGARFAPDAGGTQPSDQYDVTILDSNGLDILVGKGLNLSNDITATTNFKTPLTTDNGFPYVVDENVTPVVANAGDSKSGYIYIVVKQ